MLALSQTRHVRLSGSITTEFKIVTKMEPGNDYEPALFNGSALHLNMFAPVSFNRVVSVHTEVQTYGVSELFSALLALANTCLAVIVFLFPTEPPHLTVPRFALWRGSSTAERRYSTAVGRASVGKSVPVATPKAAEVEMTGMAPQTNPALQLDGAAAACDSTKAQPTTNKLSGLSAARAQRSESQSRTLLRNPSVESSGTMSRNPAYN